MLAHKCVLHMTQIDCGGLVQKSVHQFDLKLFVYWGDDLPILSLLGVKSVNEEGKQSARKNAIRDVE